MYSQKSSSRVGLLFLLLMLLSSHSTQAADVALDIGHTLRKLGVITERGVTEFELNRRLVVDIAQNLRETGIDVRVINSEGEIDTLTRRTALAALDRLFVSIHHDSVKARYRPVTKSRFQGYSLWVSEDAADYVNSVRCARLIADSLIRAKFYPSHYHAHPVFGENRPVVDWDRGIFSNKHLAVLRTARAPAVLVEAGVVANPDEEARLSDPMTHSALVAAISDGLRECSVSLPSAVHP